MASDTGNGGAKVFVLIYDLPNTDSVFQRYPPVEGSVFFAKGVGVNYNRSDNVVLAPVRVGVGWRPDLEIGYLRVAEKPSWLPF